MLDGVHAGGDRHPRRRVAVAVRRHLASPGVGLGDDGVHLRLGQLGRVDRVGEREHAARRHTLMTSAPYLTW